MAPVDLRCDRLSKRYQAGRRRFGRSRARASLPPDPRRDASGEFWALRDVTFEVERGETLGVIGRNGAGKSTLLKLLSGITTPTEGEITIAGRLSALIEVGSGFHPELTGRENVFLSGAILGMRRRDIAARMDSIADFSGIGAFLDTPVKHYSSGMYVRLGFSIAAHLEPDVLLVDEVLAVGDAEFQARCVQRVQDLKRRGTTILVVSHDLGAVEQLADRAILFDAGRIAAQGPVSAVVAAYQRLTSGADLFPENSATDGGPDGNGSIRIEHLSLHGPDGLPLLAAKAGSPLRARLALMFGAPIAATVALSFYDFQGGALLCECRTDVEPPEDPGGPVDVEFVLPELLLAPGVYTLGATVTPAGGSRPVAWRFGRTTLYVQGPSHGRGVFSQPFQARTLAAAASLQPF